MRAAFPIIALLASCGEGPAPDSAADRRGQVAPEARGGKAALRMRTGATVPLALPQGFSLYPGAQVVSNTIVEREGERRVLLVFETPDPLTKVMAFHRSQAEAAGVELTLDLGGARRASIGGRLPSGGVLAIAGQQGAAGTRVEFSAN